MSLEDVEALLIKKALARFDGNVSHAAERARPEPQRALPAAAALRAVGTLHGADSAAKPAPVRVIEGRHRCLTGRCWPGCPARWSTALVLLWTGDFTPKVQWTLTRADRGLLWWGFALAVRERVVFPLQTLSNLLAALREGDFSVRGRAPRPDDALGEVMREVNTLGGTLREQRLGALEATTLLRTVMEEIDVAVFAFDERQRLRLVNRAGERLLAQPAERLLGATRGGAATWPTASTAPAPRTFQTAFPGGAGPLGRAPHTRPRARPAARAAGDLRPHPGPARAGTAGLAAAGARARPRAEQFADARSNPSPAAWRASWRANRCRRTGATTCAAAWP